MGNFDFGQFQQIFEYLSNKLKEGGALTPEEQQVYDNLIGISNQGLNLTGTADFNSLYNAFNSLADQGTKDEFEKLYGKGLVQDANGNITFTQPGTLIEQLMRRGQSVNDGPAMAMLSQGLKDYLKTIAQNKFAAMTNSYAAMTPIRAQNIQALTNAGNVASTAIGRRVPIGGFAVTGGRAGSGDVGGEGVSIDTRGGGADKPGFFDKFGPAILGILGTAGLGVGGYLLKDWWQNRNKTPEGDVLGEGPLGNTDRNPYTGQALTSPYEMSSQNPDAAMSMYNPTTNPYGNTGNLGPDYYNTPSQQYYSNPPLDQYWNQPDQQTYNQPQSYNFNDYGYNQTTPSYSDWTNGSGYGGWDFGTPPDQSYYPDNYGGDYYNYGGNDTYYPDYSSASDTSGWAY